MALNENARQPLIDPFASNSSSYVKYTEPLLTTTIDMISSSKLSIPDDQFSNKGKSGFRRKLIEKQSTVKGILMVDLSRRLASRKELHIRLSYLTDIMCVLAIMGILLMIIENEITFQYIYNRETILSWFIKLIITISTVILVVLVLVYHRLDLTLYAINHSIEDWRFGLTNKTIFLIVLEIIICAIHPIPRTYPTEKYIIEQESRFNSTEPPDIPLSYVPFDVALGLPIFARLYLLFRCMLYHSHLIRNSSAQSFGYLNRVSIDLYFLIRTYLEQWPGRFLLSLCAGALLIGSWCLRACNYTYTATHLSMSDAIWLFIVTSTSVGYGDIIPTTYWGRAVAAMVGLFGIFANALLVAVFSQKLVLHRAEKYVHNFVLKAELANEYKHEASNIIKYAIQLWISKRNHKRFSSINYFETQRKLFGSINNVRQIKQGEKMLIDNCIGFIELAMIQRDTNAKTSHTKRKMIELKSKVDRIEEQLINTNNTINNMQNTLNAISDKLLSSYL